VRRCRGIAGRPAPFRLVDYKLLFAQSSDDGMALPRVLQLKGFPVNGRWRQLERKEQLANCDRGSDYRNARTRFHEFTLQTSMRLISFSPVLTDAALFRSTDSGQNWRQINNGLLALYESALAINTNGYIFVEADFVG